MKIDFENGKSIDVPLLSAFAIKCVEPMGGPETEARQKQEQFYRENPMERVVQIVPKETGITWLNYDARLAVVDLSDGDQVAEALSRFLNIMANRKEQEKFAEKFAKDILRDHLTLVQVKMKVIAKFIEYLAESPYVDARNESAVDFAKKVVQNTSEDDRRFPFI